MMSFSLVALPTWTSSGHSGHLRLHGLQVEPCKCKAWVSRNTEVGDNIQTHVPVTLEGIPVLDMAAQATQNILITLGCHPTLVERLLADAHGRAEQADEN